MKRPMTKSERIARDRLIYHCWIADNDFDADHHALREEVPDAWHTIEADLDCFEPKEKVTLYLDKSVAKIFKAMGTGYQARINRILATWIQHKAAGLREAERVLSERMARETARRE